jgi:hypothetical protein
MAPNWLFFAELTIFNGTALAWAAWEIWSVRRSKREARGADDAPRASASEEPPRHPEG